ncbi:hypothetical protein [Pedobacter immunditicola]|uniref:hypothetical protein n=1 Tax=Pedobacter immunditicola TaxID=3133440 RepID=UPI0030A57690
MNQKYRGLYFLGATLGIGLLIIGGMKVFSAAELTSGPTNAPIEQKSNGHQTLESKIKEFSKTNFSPKQYNNLLIEINSGASQSLFNKDIKNMLIEQLNVKYKELAMGRINSMLQADPIDQGELDNLISHMEGTFGHKKEYQDIKSNLKALRYYTLTLPQKVNSLINQGFAEFDDKQFEVLKAELERKVNLTALFRNKRAVLITQNTELQRLQNFHDGYLDWSLEMLK